MEFRRGERCVKKCVKHIFSSTHIQHNRRKKEKKEEDIEGIKPIATILPPLAFCYFLRGETLFQKLQEGPIREQMKGTLQLYVLLLLCV